MRSGFRIARLFGINVFVDWSWIFIFLLVTWQLAAVVFPSIHGDWGTGLTIGISVLASLLFFVSVLAHELAHSIVARARGLPVRSIVLFIFGGVSNIEREPPSPATEFLMAVVGPLTSLLIGAACIFAVGPNLPAGAANVPQALAQLDPLYTMLVWLGSINILLGLFNLIPGFPLDGGRILRSILWAMTGNLRRATRWATLAGQLIAWIFIIAGFAMVFGFEVPIFGTGLLGGLWLAFIGWFLNNAASQSYQQVVVQDLLEGVPVSRLMRADAPTVSPDVPVSTLVYDHIMGTDEHAFPVVEDERLVGLVCLEDVRSIPREDWDDVQVRQVMTPYEELDMVTPREDATAALQKISGRDVRQVPVVQDGRLVGMLRRRDIMRWLQLQSETSR